MKQTILFLYCIFLGSCYTPIGEVFRPEIDKYTWSTDKQILFEDPGGPWCHYKVDTGAFIVFKYSHISKDYENAADEVTFQRVLFEIDSSLALFRIIIGEKDIRKIYYSHSGAWHYTAHEAVSGEIRGEKIDQNKWFIELRLKFEPVCQVGITRQLKFKQVFVKE